MGACICMYARTYIRWNDVPTVLHKLDARCCATRYIGRHIARRTERGVEAGVGRWRNFLSDHPPHDFSSSVCCYRSSGATRRKRRDRGYEESYSKEIDCEGIKCVTKYMHIFIVYTLRENYRIPSLSFSFSSVALNKAELNRLTLLSKSISINLSRQIIIVIRIHYCILHP